MMNYNDQIKRLLQRHFSYWENSTVKLCGTEPRRIRMVVWVLSYVSAKPQGGSSLLRGGGRSDGGRSMALRRK